MRARTPSVAGFTLVELVTTLAVLAIVAAGGALVWPRLAAALRLEAALHQVAADLHDARGLAVASAARARLTFTRGGTSYRLERADDDGGYWLAARRVLPPGVRVDDVNSGGDLVFSARGQAENGTVVLADARGVRASLRINQRGRVTVDRGRS